MNDFDLIEIEAVVRKVVKEELGNLLITCDSCKGSGVKYDYELDGRECTKCNGSGQMKTKDRFEDLFCDCTKPPFKYNELGGCKYCGKQKKP